MLNAGGGECCRAVLTGFPVAGSQNSRITLNDMVFDGFFIVSSEQNWDLSSWCCCYWLWTC